MLRTSKGPLFRPVRGNQQAQEFHRHPDEIDRILRKYAKCIGLTRGYSAHSMRATFITTALDNGASLERRIAGHRSCRSLDHKTLRPPRLQSREVSGLLRELLRATSPLWKCLSETPIHRRGEHPGAPPLRAPGLIQSLPGLFEALVREVRQ
jgi:integrase